MRRSSQTRRSPVKGTGRRYTKHTNRDKRHTEFRYTLGDMPHLNDLHTGKRLVDRLGEVLQHRAIAGADVDRRRETLILH